jgi:hypothetical protein
VSEESIARRDVARAQAALTRATEKRLSAEGYLFRARVPSRIYHLILDPSLPPSPDPSVPTTVPAIVASQGPADEGWGSRTWSDPPSRPMRNMQPACSNCGLTYFTEVGCPFPHQCHRCWEQDHQTQWCPVCDKDTNHLETWPADDPWEPEYGMVPSDDEA